MAPAARLAVGELFARAAEPEKALAQFEIVRRASSPSETAATLGAARMLVALHRYREARPLLDEVRDRAPAARDEAALVERILALDPLAPGLARGERRQRVRAVARHLSERLDGCRVDAVDQAERDSRLAEIERLAKPSAAGRRDEGNVPAASRAIDEAQRWVDARCPSQAVTDRALTLVADAHASRW
jgi:hypothetical protein